LRGTAQGTRRQKAIRPSIPADTGLQSSARKALPLRLTRAQTLFLLGRRSHRFGRRRGLRLHRLRLQHLATLRSAPRVCSVKRQRDGSNHERHGRPRGGSGKRAGRAGADPNAVWLPCPHKAAEISPLFPLCSRTTTMMKKQTRIVDSGNQVNHKFGTSLIFRPAMFGSVRVRILLTEDKIMVRRDLNYSITLITR